MEITEHIAAVGREAALFGDAAREGGFDVEVAGCPGWNMRDLVRHLSEIHLWAGGVISRRATKLFPDDISEHVDTWPDLAVFWPHDDELVDWYLETNANLVRCLEETSPTDDIPTFLPAPSPLAMWARRQAHEIAVHRFDAQTATGIYTGFDPVFAADGIDELLTAFAPRASKLERTTTQAMVVHTSDTGNRWHITLSPEGIDTLRGDGPADVTLTADASDLYLALWNRTADANVAVTGDRRLLEYWHENHRVRWSS